MCAWPSGVVDLDRAGGVDGEHPVLMLGLEDPNVGTPVVVVLELPGGFAYLQDRFERGLPLRPQWGEAHLVERRENWLGIGVAR